MLGYTKEPLQSPIVCLYMHVPVFLQDEIISKLKERLLVEHSLAYEPLLDLLVQFARDIQSEFYPYFKELFPILVRMCDCQDADLIQVYHNNFKLTIQCIRVHVAVFIPSNTKNSLVKVVSCHIRPKT